MGMKGEYFENYELLLFERDLTSSFCWQITNGPNVTTVYVTKQIKMYMAK